MAGTGAMAYNSREMKRVEAIGSFDDLRSGQVRFLEEASRLGPLTVFVRDDEAVRALTGHPPKFPAAERLYVVSALKYVFRAEVVSGPGFPAGPADSSPPEVWAVPEGDDHPEDRAAAAARGVEYRTIPEEAVRGFPGSDPHLTAEDGPAIAASSKKRVIVTGCYDWLHSGHVRFFEEASAFVDVFVDVGSDANIRLLKGGCHPLFPQAERLYMVQAVRHVRRAFIGTGVGWMDAAPEIEILKPDSYLVNEDGDRPEKREFCAARGIAYVVLKRAPAPGLPRRDSTALRGF